MEDALMGIRYSHDAQANVTTWVWDGVVAAEEWGDEARAQIAEPFWPPRGNLSDITTADLSAITDADIASVAQLYTDEGGRAAGIQLAIIADGAFPQALAFESAVAPAGQRVIVFTDVSAGCTWLGIDVSTTLTTIRRMRDELRAS
jgi:hypothetical protein